MATAAKVSLYHALSSALLIDSSVFNKATPAEQTAAILAADGKPVVFCDNLATIKNRRRLRDKLLAGEDVSIELEVCGIALTAEELEVLRKVRPLLDRLAVPSYPWLPEEDHPDEFMLRTNNTMIRRSSNQGNYSISTRVAQRVWDAASRYWAEGVKPTRAPEITADGYRRTLEIYDDRVVIGCQTVTRGKVEYLARKLGWATPA